jgi:hypothetical protein
MEDASANDPQFQRLVNFLVEAEPVLRTRIRELRGPHHPLLSTSDLHAAVVHQMVEHETGRESTGITDKPALPLADPKPSGATDHHRWRSLMSVTERTVTDALKLVEQARAIPASGPGYEFRDDSGEDQAEVRAKVASLLSWLDPIDRHLLQLRVRGTSWKAIAATTELDEAACRQRWVRLLKELRNRMGN